MIHHRHVEVRIKLLSNCTVTITVGRASLSHVANITRFSIYVFVRFGEPNYLFENLEEMADYVIDQFNEP